MRRIIANQDKPERIIMPDIPDDRQMPGELLSRETRRRWRHQRRHRVAA